jgi:hypothetical protein
LSGCATSTESVEGRSVHKHERAQRSYAVGRW